MVTAFKKLGDRRYQFMARCSKMFGNYDPENLGLVSEELTEKEYHVLYKYSEWMTQNDKKQGWGNYELRYSEWLSTLGPERIILP